MTLPESVTTPMLAYGAARYTEGDTTGAWGSRPARVQAARAWAELVVAVEEYADACRPPPATLSTHDAITACGVTDVDGQHVALDVYRDGVRGQRITLPAEVAYRTMASLRGCLHAPQHARQAS